MSPIERAALGIVLNAPDRLRELAHLTAAHFAQPEHAEILAMLRDLRTWDLDILHDESARRLGTGGPNYVVPMLLEHGARESLRPLLDRIEAAARERATASRALEASVGAWGPVVQAVALPTPTGSLVVPCHRVQAAAVNDGRTSVLVDGRWLLVDDSIADVCRALRWTGGLAATACSGRRRAPEPPAEDDTPHYTDDGIEPPTYGGLLD